MTPSTSLFDLIKSLSKSEKRYFKLNAALQAGNKNYLKLFDTIDKMDEYKEEIIKKKFHKEKFIRQLTFTKNYLYNLICKSLNSYYAKHSIENHLNDLMFRANYFYKKALYKDFRNSIKLGKKLSLEYERFGYFIQFSSLEKNLFFGKKNTPGDENALLSSEELVAEKISNLSVYDSYVSMLTSVYREEGIARDVSLFNYIERIKSSPLLTSEDYAMSCLAKERFHYLLQLMAEIYGDYDEVYYHCKKRLDILSANPKPFSDRIFNYWGDVLMYLILICIRLNKSKKMIEYLHLLEKHTSTSQSDKIYLFLVQSYLSVYLVMTEKRWDKMKDLMDSIEKGLCLYKDKLDSNFEIELYNLLVRMHVMAVDYSSALKYMVLLLNHPLIVVRRDLEYNARVLNLIIHYELGNYEYLEHLILSTYRFLYKRKKIFALETLILNFIRRLPRIESDKDLAENFFILRKEMRTIYKRPHEKNIFMYFDYLEWVNRKLKEIKV